jgi:hypothetical protein
MYFEIELKQVINSKIEEDMKDWKVRKNATESNVYDFQQLSILHFIVIRDITNVINSQQKLSDDMYQDAIEQNYSHE